jgi:hypothetical protein
VSVDRPDSPGLEAYVERQVNMATTGGVAAWTFEPSHWGGCGQGLTEEEALADLTRRCGVDIAAVVERVDGDEQTFVRDLAAPSADEVARTLEILEAARTRTLSLVEGASAEALDRADPHRVLPDWASWRTPRQLAWHIADTECRYYLPSLGLPAKDRTADLLTELRESARHVRSVLHQLPAEPLVRRNGAEVWTSVKLLRRLAWHERGEVEVLARLTAVPGR